MTSVAGIFISHTSSEDELTRRPAYRIEEALRTADHRVFLDARTITVADLWRPLVYRHLARCDDAVLLPAILIGEGGRGEEAPRTTGW